MADPDLAAIEKRLAAASGTRWQLASSPDGTPIVRVVFDNGEAWDMRVTRDDLPATDDDVRFVACVRDDLESLLAHLKRHHVLSDRELGVITERVERASPGPWYVFLERDGGMGGCDMIRVSDLDSEPDLYLWVDGDLAPSNDFELVGEARQDIPQLLDAATTVREHS